MNYWVLAKISAEWTDFLNFDQNFWRLFLDQAKFLLKFQGPPLRKSFYGFMYF